MAAQPGYEQVSGGAFQKAKKAPPGKGGQKQSLYEVVPPPISSMDQYQGYENTKFSAGAFIPPPAFAPQAVNEGQSKPVNADVPLISNDRACQALQEEVGHHCCYGKAAANEVDVTNLEASSAFHYRLETFTEGRKTAWAFDPYTGQPIDDIRNGIPPAPWDIHVQPGQAFKDEERQLEVPHTGSIKSCHNCFGMGKNKCWMCLEQCQITCETCNGTAKVDVRNQDGSVQKQDCRSCKGSGKIKCPTCQGTGNITCEVCLGKKQLKCYIKMTVTWKNHIRDHVVEKTALPDHLIKQAQGRKVFEDTQLRVYPVTGFPDDSINRASQQLIQLHATSFPTERILSQRHWIKIVPVFEAQGDFRGKRFTFWVYGEDNNVHAPSYPQKYCWGCSII